MRRASIWLLEPWPIKRISRSAMTPWVSKPSCAARSDKAHHSFHASMGLDIGTTGCKAIVFDLDGNILSSDYEEYPLHTPQPGWLELDPVQVWQSVAKVVRTATAGAADPVQALSISCLGEAGAMLDKDGNVLCNSIVCFDNRAMPRRLRKTEWTIPTAVNIGYCASFASFPL